MRKWLKRIILICLLLVLVASISIVGYKKLHSNNKQEGDTIVKENVKVITSETEKQPISVEEDSVVFDSNPKYKAGDVIVSGITDASPNGFVRKVIKVEKRKGRYIVKTEHAVLTEVFEKADIYKKILLTEDENKSVNYTRDNMPAVLNEVSLDNILCKDDDGDNGTDYVFGQTFEEKKEPLSLSGEVGISMWIEVEMHIDHGEIECGITARTEEGIKVVLGCSESCEKEWEKVLLGKQLPSFQFVVAGIPIVITNEFKISLEAEMNLDGDIGTIYELTSETTQGFKYSSKTGKVKEINEINHDSDGLEWNTISISGDASGGIGVHLVSKLYGGTGLDMSMGITGEAEGEAKACTKEELNGYAGSLDLSINPEIKGELVVGVPVIDKNLSKQALFQVKLSPLWSKHWESSANWQEDLQWRGADGVENEVENEVEEQVEFSYSNEYFDVQVPESWDGYWNVTEEDNSMNGIMSRVYHFTYNPEGENNGGASDVYVIDMSDASRPMGHYNRMIPDYCDFVGVTSFGEFNVFKMEVAAGFFHDGGATITLK